MFESSLNCHQVSQIIIYEHSYKVKKIVILEEKHKKSTNNYFKSFFVPGNNKYVLLYVRMQIIIKIRP